MNTDEYIAVWADDTWCMLEDLEEYLSFMSDDYYMLHIDHPDAVKFTHE